jgi:5-methylcytosine-specific restriction protein A
VDEWTDEGLFSYTGGGQHGDMKFTKGNRAIRDYKDTGKSLLRIVIE